MNNFFKNLGIGKRKLIEDWLENHCTGEYTIDDNLIINGSNDIIISLDENETELPDYIQFGEVFSFEIGYNRNLKSLRGCPHKAIYFSCNGCWSLLSLEGAPKDCFQFFCCYCKSLTTLKGIPQTCDKIRCSGCTGLENLDNISPTTNSVDCRKINNKEMCEKFSMRRINTIVTY